MPDEVNMVVITFFISGTFSFVFGYGNTNEVETKENKIYLR